MNRVRILLVIPTLDQSGAEKQLTLLATGLPQQHYAVHVVALTRGGPFESELRGHGVTVSVLKKRWKFDPLCLRSLARIIRDWKPDLIHSWLFAANAYVRLVTGGPGKIPVVVSERCVDSWKSGWQLFLDRWLVRRTARLVGNSHAVMNFYEKQGIPKHLLRVVPNGQPIPESQSSTFLSESMERRKRSRFDLPPESHILMYVGRLARQKRVLDLIWMLVLIQNLRQDVYLVLIGDGPERDLLERYCRELNVEKQVLFLGHRTDAGELLSQADIFFLASDFEGMSNSLMEAMAHGLPVICSDIPPNRELVEHERTGMLIPVGDRAAYARAALALIEHPETAQMMGDAGRARIRNQFSVDIMVNRYEAVYKEVLPSFPAESS